MDRKQKNKWFGFLVPDVTSCWTGTPEEQRPPAESRDRPASTRLTTLVCLFQASSSRVKTSRQLQTTTPTTTPPSITASTVSLSHPHTHTHAHTHSPTGVSPGNTSSEDLDEFSKQFEDKDVTMTTTPGTTEREGGGVCNAGSCTGCLVSGAAAGSVTPELR